MIDFEWTMEARRAELFAAVLDELEIEASSAEQPAIDAAADDVAFALLERAGLMLDQQSRAGIAHAGALVTGAASAEALALALVRWTHEADTGGLLIDVARVPAQITEVRGINGPIVVLADAAGARQLQIDPHLIAAALARATAPA